MVAKSGIAGACTNNARKDGPSSIITALLRAADTEVPILYLQALVTN